ncbi:cytochrome P450 [Xylariomycetidae sp. FL2044]|nr:cytochrome P450 [Xylariomycetidae sp. FL2044]
MFDYDDVVGFGGYNLPIGPVSVLLLFVSSYVVYRWALPKPLPSIPYDKESANSIWGDKFKLRNDSGGLAKWGSKQLEKHGSPICQAFLEPFSKPVILVGDLREVRDVFSRGDYDRSAYIIDRFPLLGDFHLNMMTNNDWRTSRSWLKDLLDKPHMHNVVGPSVHTSMIRLLELWEDKARLAQGRSFNMVDDLKQLALDTIMVFHFGNDFTDSAVRRQLDFTKELTEKDVIIGKLGEVDFPRAPLHEFQQALTYLGDRITAIYATKWPVALVSGWLRWGTPYYRKLFSYKDAFIKKHIQLGIQRSLNNGEAQNGIDSMVLREQKAARKAGRPTILGKHIMVDETWGNLVAGQHTTSAALVWILKLLADYPDVQAKLHGELQAALSNAVQENRLPTSDEIIHAKIPYLDAVLEEMLRLRAGMVVPRDTVRDTELLGRRIPKGTVVLMILQGPDFSPAPTSQYWKEAKKNASLAGQYPGHGNPDLEVFDPERWLIRDDRGDITEFDGSTFPQLAFGIGIRACWGRRLAMLETRIMTAMMVWKFEFLPVPKPLASHAATYDISYRAKLGYVNLKSR